MSPGLELVILNSVEGRELLLDGCYFCAIVYHEIFNQ